MTNLTDIPYTPLTLKQMQKALRDLGWIKDTDLTITRFLGAAAVYRHSDGRVLVASPSVGVIYPSQKDLDVFIEWMRQSRLQATQHILSTRFPYGEDFPAHVHALVEQLGQLLKIPQAELDYTWGSLEKVEKKIKHRGRQKSLSLPIFPALLAYVGEVMRRDVQGEWQMRRDRQDPTIWTPWIVDEREHEFNPWEPLYDGLDEDADDPTIHIGRAATVEVAVKRRYLPPHKRKPGPISLMGDDPPPEN